MTTGSGSGAFCPRCGDVIEHLPSPDATMETNNSPLCDSCFFSDLDLVETPDRIQVRVCKHCGAVHRGNRWVDVGAADYADVAIEETTESLQVHVDAEDVDWSVRPERQDANALVMHCHFSANIRDQPVSEEQAVPVYISRETCDRCGRIAGDYYASIVQLRAGDRTPTASEQQRAIEIAESIVANRESDGDREAFITSIKEHDAGVDFKVSTNKLGNTIATRITRELGGSVSDAPTLVTEDGDGNEVYRVTFTARLPPFVPGDIISVEGDDEPVLVQSAHGNLKGVRLGSGDAYEAGYEEGIAPDAEKVATSDHGTETTVVTIEDEYAVQVLDPETYAAKTIPRPSYLDSSAETVPVIKTPNGVYVLPDE